MVVDEVTSDDLDRLFHALSDATRRDIVARVMLQEQSVSALAARYAMSFAAVQKHVAVLERATLVSKQRHGREQIVSGNPQSILRAREALERFEEIWRGRTDRMRAILLEETVGDKEVTGPTVAATPEAIPTRPPSTNDPEGPSS